MRGLHVSVGSLDKQIQVFLQEKISQRHDLTESVLMRGLHVSVGSLDKQIQVFLQEKISQRDMI